MKKLKTLFSTPKKAILFSSCIVIALALCGAGTAFAAEFIAEKNSIGKSSAEDIALKDMGVNKENIQNENTDFDYEDGEFVYDVELTADGKKYEYRIKASDGTILIKENEEENKIFQTTEKETVNTETTIAETTDTSVDKAVTNDNFKGISIAQAKSAALKDAGVSSSKATFTKSSLDTDDGITVYDIEFYTSDAEYDYEINTSTGDVISKDKETRRTVSSSKTNAVAEKQKITVVQAKSAALKDAGVSSSKATFTKSSLDTDDGVMIYDIEFYTSNAEYDYEINASTGGVVSRDIEKKKSPTTTKQAAVKKYIGVDAAKTIALKHANVSSSGVSFGKAKLENDDGRYEYEIEFYSKTKEYEYTVDALTGAIIEHDVEMMDD